jgi:hypothetical protein
MTRRDVERATISLGFRPALARRPDDRESGGDDFLGATIVEFRERRSTPERRDER